MAREKYITAPLSLKRYAGVCDKWKPRVDVYGSRSIVSMAARLPTRRRWSASELLATRCSMICDRRSLTSVRLESSHLHLQHQRTHQNLDLTQREQITQEQNVYRKTYKLEAKDVLPNINRT